MLAGNFSNKHITISWNVFCDEAGAVRHVVDVVVVVVVVVIAVVIDVVVVAVFVSIVIVDVVVVMAALLW